MNRRFFQQRAAEQRAHQFKPAAPTAVQPSIQHPHRALPPGHQWVGHDKAGGQAAQRRLRQRAKQELKTMRKAYGSSAVEGRDADGGLLLDFGPTRAK